MNPRDALRILIERSQLSAEDKRKMTAAIPNMHDDQVEELGQALATQRKTDVDAAVRAVTALDALIATNPST